MEKISIQAGRPFIIDARQILSTRAFYWRPINIGMLCMQELFFGWINWNFASNVYIFTEGKSINAKKNENVEFTQTKLFCGRLCMLWE